MAEQKSQHWVPKFYLRNFASDSEQRQIHLFQVEEGRLIPNINLGKQCADDYFYGKDLVLEKTFGPLEGAWAEVFRGLHEKGEITPEVREHLIAFAGLQYGRTKGAVDEINEMSDMLKKLVLDPHLVATGKVTAEEAAAAKVRFENPASVSLSIVAKSLPLLSDLDLKLAHEIIGAAVVDPLER